MASSSPSLAPAVPSLLASVFGSLSAALTTLSTIGVGLYSLLLVYRRTLHPLASYPGPFLAAISHWPWWYNNIRGRQPFWLLELHTKYGPVVRYGPDDVSYIDAGDVKPGAVWNAIHGQVPGKPEFPKAPGMLPLAPNNVEPITFAPLEMHRRMRRALAGGFSERFIRDNAEPIMRRYGEKLIETLRDECSQPGRRIDITRFYNFTTFDIMGHVVYSEDLGMLESREYIEEIFVPFKYLRTIPILQMLQYYPWVNAVWKRLQPPQAVKMRQWSFQCGVDRVSRRHAKGNQLKDIWNYVLTTDADKGMSMDEQISNTELFLIAASETTGSLLAGATYLMAENPDTQARLAAEIRGAFASSADIDLQGLVGLPYLDAFMQECLRRYPPAPAGVPRYVSEENTPCTLLGRAVPLGTRIMMSHLPTYWYPGNFEAPDEFAPQRWLSVESGGEARFANDRLGAVQAFSVGPRNCIGQNMARHEFRLLLAKMVYNFDIALAPESEDWIRQLSWGVWDKGELIVRLSPVTP